MYNKNDIDLQAEREAAAIKTFNRDFRVNAHTRTSPVKCNRFQGIPRVIFTDKGFMAALKRQRQLENSYTFNL